jgi:predicted ATP-grasp superfamily ATP-dependent carboligase
MDDSGARPPAIVLGADTPIGLTVIRELGRNGVSVHAVAHARDGVGLYSRWTTRRYLRPQGADETIALLNRIARDEGARFLLAVSDHDLRLVRAAADAGRLSGLTALVPTADKLALAGDKMSIYGIAREVGVPVPMSWQPPPGGTVARAPTGLTFPCILKWSDSEAVRDALARRGLPWLKAEYCYDPAALGRALERYRDFGRYPIAQGFCPGVGLGHMIFMHRGEALLCFQHRRLAEWPPEGGFSTVCESVAPDAHAALFAKSVALLRRIGWEGAAMVEYRYDARTDSAALMEINGRFWGSLPLAHHAGAPFAWFTYAVLGLGLRPTAPAYRVGMRCRYMVPETRRVLTLLRQGGRTRNRALRFRPVLELLRYLGAFLRPKVRYYVFSLADPCPFFADTRFIMEKFIRRCLGRARHA